MDHGRIAELRAEYERLNGDGFRVLAIATKQLPPKGASPGNATPYGKADESDLVLQGYVAFLDPPKETCTVAISELQRPRRGGQGDHGRQRDRRPQDLHGGGARRSASRCSAPTSNG